MALAESTKKLDTIFASHQVAENSRLRDQKGMDYARQLQHNKDCEILESELRNLLLNPVNQLKCVGPRSFGISHGLPVDCPNVQRFVKIQNSSSDTQIKFIVPKQGLVSYITPSIIYKPSPDKNLLIYSLKYSCNPHNEYNKNQIHG
jgi:hypothetical protein